MRKLILIFRLVFAGLFCAGIAAGAAVWMVGLDPRPSPRRQVAAKTETAARAASRKSDQPAEPAGDFIDKNWLEDSGLGVAFGFTGTVRNPESLRELREAIRMRGRLGLAVLGAEVDQLDLGPQPTAERVTSAIDLYKKVGLLRMYQGRFDLAVGAFERALELGRSASSPPSPTVNELTALLGIASLRRGELDNCLECLGPSSCIFPIAPEATHKRQAGSRAAVAAFQEYLDRRPGDLRVRWLLNVACMTLGEYPAQVPPRHRIPLDTFASKLDVGRFDNVASIVGLTARGPNMAGGSAFDDFDGDGLPDVITSSLDADLGASLSINRGDGTFEDRTESAGLADQIYALNLRHADFDNDGDLDVVLLRGGWDVPMRLSLLRNRGDGRFDDVTVAAGLAEPISTESAAWGDFDADGLLDLFVCGETLPAIGGQPAPKPDPRNRCRLYRNQGDGTFVNVADKAGVAAEMYAKGSAWGDYDGDGRLDLYVANMIGPSRLFHNEGDGTFRDVAADLGVTGSGRGFACWFWDFDNDGRLDLYVNDRGISLAEEAANALGIPNERAGHPRLYRNVGDIGFRDVTREVGLDRPVTPMGCNFGDIDNDGYLDIYLGTGGMSFSYLVPNLLFKNVEGRRFEDVTMSSGTGHLQKGHGVSFADADADGDLDLFVEAGGASPGDSAYNLLFRNPGHGRHWLKVKLVGAQTNRSALGARIKVVVPAGDGSARAIYRTVGNNSSFGGNTLVESFGLLDATNVSELEVSWPVSRTTQTFRDLPADQAIEITEGADSFRPLPPPPPRR